MTEEKEETYPEKLQALIDSLRDNQETIDSNERLKLRDIRKYVGDLNFSFLTILEKIQKSVTDAEKPVLFDTQMFT
ncbi:hypothetical protein LCGC14_1737060 [marine sediment metagenome]|uniref:Uncharacterized protein n=1 Tax=marine sediment metagenome TaxID=412755 RepID=A0A0F9HVF7_9ZZZZ